MKEPRYSSVQPQLWSCTSMNSWGSLCPGSAAGCTAPHACQLADFPSVCRQRSRCFTWGSKQRYGVNRLRHHFVSPNPSFVSSSSGVHVPPSSQACRRGKPISDIASKHVLDSFSKNITCRPDLLRKLSAATVQESGVLLGIKTTRGKRPHHAVTALRILPQDGHLRGSDLTVKLSKYNFQVSNLERWSVQLTSPPDRPSTGG